ncbi:transposase [Streptomyces sp. NBC_00145]|uniref:transposase n=1 Tax=Streptomyces sp. NBC_00145 TaxID=2975666 RepID=UPI002E17475A
MRQSGVACQHHRGPGLLPRGADELSSQSFTVPVEQLVFESSQRLGRHRWVVERTVSWLAGCRRLHRRYERKAEHYLAYVGIAAALICHRRLVRADGQDHSA